MIHFVCQGAPLAGAAAVAFTALRRATTQARYAAGCAALIAMALAPVATTVLVLGPSVAIWRLSHRVRVERQYCCDDWAIPMSGNRVEYARALTSLEQMRQPGTRRPFRLMRPIQRSLQGRLRSDGPGNSALTAVVSSPRPWPSLGLIWGYGTRVQRNSRVARARFSAKMQKQAGF